MEVTFSRTDIERDYKYMQDIKGCEPFVIKESGSMDYGSAVVLLRNLGEKKDMTSLERDALSAAVRLLQRNIDADKQ